MGVPIGELGGQVDLAPPSPLLSDMALSLNISLDRLTAHIACRREKVGMRPERGKFPQLGKLLAQEA